MLATVMLVTIQRMTLQSIAPDISPVTALCIGAIALLLMGLLLYLSKLLATRLAITLQGTQPLPPPEPVRQLLLQELKREVSAQLPPESAPLHPPLQWNAELRVGQKAVKLTTTRHMLEAFQQPQMAGKLVIVGEAGAGKTTLLTHLMDDLLQRSLRDTCEESPQASLPVLLNLGGWTERYLSFEQWLVVALKAKYGLRSDMAQHWLETQQLFLFLDGLDELEASLQAFCLQAISQFQQTFQPPGLVLCAPPEAYEQTLRLETGGMIWLQPLAIAQVEAHLKAVAQPEVWRAIQQDPQLLRLAQSPLMLKFLPLMWLDPSHHVSHSSDLLALYVTKNLGRDNPYSTSPQGHEPQPSQTLHWLSWLARSLQKRGQSEFLIERMQPSWLPSRRQRVLHRVGVVVAAAGLVGTIAALTDLISDLGISSPVFWGIIAGAIAAFPDRINLVETLSWSRNQAWRGLRVGALVGAIASLCLGVFLLAICSVIFLIDPIFIKSIRETLISGGFLGITIVLLTGLMGALLTGLLGPAIERRSFPNQGIWRSARNTLIFALTGFVIGSWVTGLFSGVLNLFFDTISPIVHIPLMFRILYYPPVMLKTGLMMGAISGLTAGMACLQHFILRVMLWRNGSIPWNYARFLTHVTQRTLMQQLGGRYRFTHSLLRNYLAQVHSSSSRSASEFSAGSEVSLGGSNNTL